MKKNKHTSRVKIGCIFQCGTVLGLLYLLVPLASLTAQSQHDFKYNPLSLIDHKLSFAYEYIPGNGKWGVEVSWERYASFKDYEKVDFPNRHSIEVREYQKRFDGASLLVKRYFSKHRLGLRQYIGLGIYYEGATQLKLKSTSLDIDKIYRLEEAFSYQGLSIELNLGYKFLMGKRWLIEPRGAVRFLMIPASSFQLGGGKSNFELSFGYRL